MSNMCYMGVHCLARDRHIFEEIGFTDDFDYWDDTDEQIVTLIDHEARWAHAGLMPESIPYFGHHTASANWNAERFYCKPPGGRCYEEVGVGGGYIMHLVNPEIDADNLRKIREFDDAFNGMYSYMRSLLPDMAVAELP